MKFYFLLQHKHKGVATTERNFNASATAKQAKLIEMLNRKSLKLDWMTLDSKPIEICNQFKLLKLNQDQYEFDSNLMEILNQMRLV